MCLSIRPITMRYGDVFNGSAQKLGVNVIASPPSEEKWYPVNNVVIAPGERWYYASLANDIHDNDDREDDGPVYLIHEDKVGDDGWGGITIYRDVSLVSHGSSILPTFTNMMW